MKHFSVKDLHIVAYAYRDKLMNLLIVMLVNNYITLVTTPTKWCAPIVVVPKKESDDIPFCADFSKLNKYVPRYPLPTPHEGITDIASIKAKFFTKFDALSRVWKSSTLLISMIYLIILSHRWLKYPTLHWLGKQQTANYWLFA